MTYAAIIKNTLPINILERNDLEQSEKVGGVEVHDDQPSEEAPVFGILRTGIRIVFIGGVFGGCWTGIFCSPVES
jgi:hypothetical protein